MASRSLAENLMRSGAWSLAISGSPFATTADRPHGKGVASISHINSARPGVCSAATAACPPAAVWALSGGRCTGLAQAARGTDARRASARPAAGTARLDNLPALRAGIPGSRALGGYATRRHTRSAPARLRAALSSITTVLFLSLGRTAPQELQGYVLPGSSRRCLARGYGARFATCRS